MAEEKDDILDDVNTDGISEETLRIMKSNLSNMSAPTIDTSAIDEQIKKLSTPASSSVYDKQAALYRMQGSGRVLQRQKNLELLYRPALELYKARKALSDSEFNARMEKLPDYDDTNIFGEQTNTTIPLADNIKSISNKLKEDYRLISNLNPNVPLYDEVRKRIEKNEKIIVNYDAVNKKLFDIRNGRDRDTGEEIARIPVSEWDGSLDDQEQQMWKDIYSGNGSNIKEIDGNLFWVDPITKEKIDLRYIGDSPTQINGAAVNAYVLHGGTVAAYANEGGDLDTYQYIAKVEASLNNIRKLRPDQIKSLIFTGYDIDPDDVYGGPKTTEFLNQVIETTYADEIKKAMDQEPDTDKKENAKQTFIVNKINEMKKLSVIDETLYKDENGKSVSLKKLFLRYQKREDRKVIQQAIDARAEFDLSGDDIDEGEDIIVGSVNVTKLNANTFYRVFQETENTGKKILEQLLPDEYMIKDAGGAKDKLKIYKNNQFIGEFDLDYDGENQIEFAKGEAMEFLRKVPDIKFFNEVIEPTEIDNNLKTSFLSLPGLKEIIKKSVNDGTLTADMIRKAFKKIQEKQNIKVLVNENGIIEGKVTPKAFNQVFADLQEKEKIDLGYNTKTFPN